MNNVRVTEGQKRQEERERKTGSHVREKQAMKVTEQMDNGKNQKTYAHSLSHSLFIIWCQAFHFLIKTQHEEEALKG